MSETTAPIGLFDRAIRRITGVWRDMAAGVSAEGDQSIAAQMRACLDARGGEVSARNRAAKLAQAYLIAGREGPHRLPPHPGRVRQRSVRRRQRLRQAAIHRRPGRARHRHRRPAPGAGTAPGAAADPVHHHPGRHEVPGGSASHPARPRQGRPVPRRARQRPARAAGQLVRRGLPGAATHRLVQPRRAAGAAGRLRGGARNPLLVGPEEPAGQRPPLLRAVPPAHAGRAADLRGGGAGARPGGQRAAIAGQEGAAAGRQGRRHRHLLLHQQLPDGALPASASATS